jgi:glycosyltransferase involved in cell wall biosynthesis
MVYNICIITGNWDKSNKSVTLSCAKLIDIILPISGCILAIVCNHNIPRKNSKFSQHEINFQSDYGTNFVKSIIFLLIYQLKVIKVIMDNHMLKKYDLVIFCFGADLMFIPIFFLRIMGKNVIIRSDGMLSAAFKNLPKWRQNSIHFIEMISYTLSRLIATEVLSDFQKFPSLIKKSWKGYIYVEKKFFVSNPKQLDQRQYSIGIVGRFSIEKGIIPITNAIVLLHRKMGNIKVIFIGEGDLQNNIENILEASGVNYTIVPWIPKEKLPEYLNDIKLLVIASEREGLPNIMLEAMACGTPVLATKVGAIPEIIRDGEMGFILESNSPECIAENVIRALSSPNIRRIAENGRQFVEKNFTFDKTVERWKKIIDAI